MALTTSMSCVKYLMFVFNLLFAITGLVVLVVGIRSEISASPYTKLTKETFFTSVPVLLILVGCLVFLIAFLGCCGAVRENHCMVIAFSVSLLIVFLIEVGVGIAAYVKRGDLEEIVVRNLNETIKYYPTDKDAQKFFDVIQTEQQCCGVNSYQDWIKNDIPIPNSCCSAHEIQGDSILGCNVNSPHFHGNGCLDKVMETLRGIVLALGGVGIGIAFVQLVGVIFACILARSIRSQYETV